METVISRDTDVVREYLAALDARERGLSPFASLAAAIKLARLKREIAETPIEATEEDLALLRREVDERLNRSLIRRLVARKWGARLSIFLMLVAGQQVALMLIFFAAWLFVNFAPVPKNWNPLLPNEQPVFLYVFLFLFFLATPLLALLTIFGGRYFRSWRLTLPLTAILVLVAAGASYLSVPNDMPFAKVEGIQNPALRSSLFALEQFASRHADTNAEGYRQWLNENWLLKDARLRADYENHLRNGPGRWITARFNAEDDAEWKDSLQVMEDYVNNGQDIAGLREWFSYYLDRNRIYSEDRIEQEVSALTGEANRVMLDVWQVEPFLREKDHRLYRAHMGSVSRRMKYIALIELAALALILSLGYITRRIIASARRAPRALANREGEPVAPPRFSDGNLSFPERTDIKTAPFFDAPFEMFSRIHRSFLRLAVFTSIFVFVFWIVVYGWAAASKTVNPPSQLALMRSYLFLVPDEKSSEAGQEAPASLSSREASQKLLSQLRAVEGRVDEGEYEFVKKYKAHDELLTEQNDDISELKSYTTEFRATASTLPTQIAELSSRAAAAEARVGEAMGQVSGVQQRAAALESQLSAKIGQVETRAARAGDQIGKIEEQASTLATRTEALEKELDRRARQIEARTEELGERTAALNEREERMTRLQRVAFAAIVSGIRLDVDEIERNAQGGVSREVRQRAESIAQRIGQITNQLREINTDQAKQLGDQLDELKKRVDQILARAR
jgi:hypothetical protein